MEVLQLGSLQSRVLALPDPRVVVVLLHGFGAPGDDLVALADFMDVGRVTWVFPEAPLALGGPYGDGRAWWMIDLDKDVGRDRSDEVPDGLVEARTAMLALLDAVAKRFPGKPIVLGGFSQGAMLALDTALHDTRPLAGLALLSGTLINRADWEPRMAARKGLRVMQSHGRRDPLLPFATAQTLRDLLVAAGCDHRWLPFEGGHEIPPPLLDLLAEFVTQS
jgi:phospholipase/carboxylesterase